MFQLNAPVTIDRFGSDHGVGSCTFSLSTRLEHASWLKSLVQGTLAASRQLGVFRVDCTWKSQDCCLAIYVDKGFCLTDRQGRELWMQPYQVLKIRIFLMKSFLSVICFRTFAHQMTMGPSFCGCSSGVVLKMKNLSCR